MAARYNNPALRQEPWDQDLTILPPIARESLFSWLENTGRFKPYETGEFDADKTSEDLDDILEPDIDLLEDEEEELDLED
jgi:hypothetical protein